MARKKIRIDIEDSDGARFDIKMEGNVTREKMLKLFEVMDLLDIEAGGEGAAATQNPDSVGGRIWNIIDKHYPMGKFTSSELLEKYEDEYNMPIKLSIISTYLARFNQKGRVSRVKSGREWTYQTQKIHQKY